MREVVFPLSVIKVVFSFFNSFPIELGLRNLPSNKGTVLLNENCISTFQLTKFEDSFIVRLISEEKFSVSVRFSL